MKRMARAITVAAMLAASAFSAQAGDTATLEILGFSPDGKIFAFEEHGMQDGSGFVFANRFYIDVEKDRFLPATPIRITVEDEEAPIGQARNNARAKGEAIIEDATLRDNAGFTAGYRSLAQVDGDPMRMIVRPRAIFPPIDKPITFALTETPFPPGENCHGLAENSPGFTLTMTPEGGEARVLHKDEAVPQSRLCPLGYSIQAIQTFYPENGEPVFAVVIAVRKLGFEGPDHRFIAVTGRL